MSKAIAFSTPARAAIRSAPSTPPAGPETRISAGCAAASSIVATPPDERITSGAGSRLGTTRVAERAEVPRDDRAEVRVGGGRRGTLVLAELGGDLVRGDDVRVGTASPQLRGDGPLVRRVTEGEQKADGDRLGVDRGQARQVERRDDAFGAHALAHADAPLQRDEGLGMVESRRYRCARFCRRRWRRCSKPSVVTNAVRAPFRSSSAFVATVVPCAKRSSARAAGRARARARAAAIDRLLLHGPGRHLRLWRRPSASRTASVKVPPTSTPRIAMPCIQQWSRGSPRERHRTTRMQATRAAERATTAPRRARSARGGAP